MKITALLVLALGLVLSGCVTTEGDSKSQAAQKQPEKNPEVGMTKDQIVAMYGKTDNKQVSSQGETWIYNLNMGEQFIPFNFGYRPKIRMITFDNEGKVANWSYSK